MAKGCRLEQWDHTASILVTLANCHRDGKRRRPYQIHDFHPFREASSRGSGGLRICPANKEVLRAVVASLSQGNRPRAKRNSHEKRRRA